MVQQSQSGGDGGGLTRPEGRLMVPISIVLAPLMIGILAALFLAWPDQSREIYRIYARDDAFEAPLPKTAAWPIFLQFLMQRLQMSQAQLDVSWLAVVLAGVCNWHFARHLTLAFARERLQESSVAGTLLRWLPRLCGALIPLGAATGLLLASADVRRLPLEMKATYDEGAAENLLYMGLIFYASAALLVLVAYLRTRNRRGRYLEADRRMFAPLTLGVMICVTLALVISFAAPITHGFGTRAAWLLGAPALFCLFVTLLAYFATGMSLLTGRTGVPVIPMLGAYVAVMAIADFNDNHAVTVARSDAALSRPAVREAFKAWYLARADRGIYERAGRPYPVFLVTAAGGGLYATDFAATGLARLQDGCAAFAQHVFAISGVSGGGLGGAMFASLVAGVPQVTVSEIGGGDPCRARPATPNGTTIESRVSALVNQDYLAPITAAGLFPDFFQRFLPFPIQSLDRSRAFEQALDLIWERANPSCTGASCSPFARPFLDAWKPDGTAPALVLNATNVDIGYRTAIAPFVIASDIPGEYTGLQDFHWALAGKSATGGDVTLGTAVALSARFPWVMPAASVQIPGGSEKLRLLDGGIFENSGVDTLTDMLIDLGPLEIAPSKRTADQQGEPWVAFHPIVISGYQLNATHGASGLRGEALSPVSAMLATRVQRAGMASYRLFLNRGYDCGKANQSGKCEPTGLRFLVLNHEDFRLPLGWQLSKFSRNVVAQHVGKPERCDPIPTIRDMFASPSAPLRQQYTRRENDCTACAIRQAMKGEALMGSGLCR